MLRLKKCTVKRNIGSNSTSCFSKWGKVSRRLPVVCGLRPGTTLTLLRCGKQYVLFCDVKYVLRHRRSLVCYTEAQSKRKGLASTGSVYMLNLYSCNAEFLSHGFIPTSPQSCSCADVHAILHEQGRDTFLISCSDISTLWHLYLLQQTITVHIANQ